jgi:hypothetical protein
MNVCSSVRPPIGVGAPLRLGPSPWNYYASDRRVLSCTLVASLVRGGR